jgi:carbonic anhydrase
MFKKIFSAALMVVSTMAALSTMTASIDYSQNGANWGQNYPLCEEGKEQSPINLFYNNT